MTVMSPEPQHARQREPRSTTALAAGAIIVCLGGAQVWFNVSSALRHSSLSAVPILAGLTPVLGSVLLSHLAASSRARTAFRVLVTVIMLGSMAVSIGATIDVTQPVFAPETWRAPVLGLVLDAASLAALWFIIDRHSEKHAAVTAVEQAQAEVEAARKRASEATGKVSGLEAELTAVKGELEAAKAQVHALRDTLNKRRASRRSSPRKKAPSSPVNNSGEPDIDTQAEALRILAEKPDISGGELGQRLGVSKSYGCRLKRELTVAAPGPEGAQS